MRTVVVAAVAVAIVLAVLAVPIHSQDQARIGAVFDISALTKELGDIKQALGDLKKQNDELKKTVEQGNKTLQLIADGVGLIRIPIRWEYKFVRSRSEKLANEEGQKGWELVNIFKDEWFVFRKPLPPDAAGEKPAEPGPAPK